MALPPGDGGKGGGEGPLAVEKIPSYQHVLLQAAFVLPRKLLTEAARYFVQAPRGHQSAAPGVSLLDKIEANCRRNVQLPRQLRDWDQFAFLQRR